MRLDLLNTLFSGTLALLAVLVRLGAQSLAGAGESSGENAGGASAALDLPAEWRWLKWFAAAAFDPALIGLALTYLIQMGDAFQWMVRQSAEVENHLVAVERITEYARLPSEAPLYTAADERLHAEWPAAPRPAAAAGGGADGGADGGAGQPGGSGEAAPVMLRLAALSATYDPALPPALDGISVALPRGCTVGVVGRTGAGKSTLLKAIFRLIEPTGRAEGAVVGDARSSPAPTPPLLLGGVDAQSLGLHTLRQCLGVIPQTPWLFSGSLRYNIDPFGNFSDEACLGAVREAQVR